mmetsp:Transcript_28207/g.69561  ORF Transcript_28207/g.69561 Transcript_28207/m.69561 type:complete len:327 (+) Transcript_28207:712-1692(+)
MSSPSARTRAFAPLPRQPKSGTASRSSLPSVQSKTSNRPSCLARCAKARAGSRRRSSVSSACRSCTPFTKLISRHARRARPVCPPSARGGGDTAAASEPAAVGGNARAAVQSAAQPSSAAEPSAGGKGEPLGGAASKTVCGTSTRKCCASEAANASARVSKSEFESLRTATRSTVVVLAASEAAVSAAASAAASAGEASAASAVAAARARARAAAAAAGSTGEGAPRSAASAAAAATAAAVSAATASKITRRLRLTTPHSERLPLRLRLSASHRSTWLLRWLRPGRIDSNNDSLLFCRLRCCDRNDSSLLLLGSRMRIEKAFTRTG